MVFRESSLVASSLGDVLAAWGPWLAFLLASFLAALVFLPYCLQNREQRGATPLAVMFVGIAVWVFSEFVQLWSAPDPGAWGGLALRMLGVKLAALGVLLLGLEYAGREDLITRKTVAALSVEPVAIVALTLVRPRQLVMVTESDAVPWGYELVATPPWMGTVLYSYLLVVVGLGLLAQIMLRAQYANRWRIFALMTAVSLPIAVNGLFYLGVTPFDLTPGSFLVTAVVLMYATFRWRLMDATPVARRTVLEQMEDMVFLLDPDGRVTAVNSAVTDTFERTERGLLDRPVEALLGDESLGNPTAGDRNVELTVRIAGEQREFDVSKSVLTDYRGDMLAQLLVCRDVTEKRRRGEQLELLKDVQSRFLRHNLRNELNAVLAHAEFMRDDTGPSREESYRVIVETSERLIEWGEKARTIERLVESPRRGSHDIARDLRQVTERMRRRYSDVEFDIDCGEELSVATVPQVDSAFENLIDNAARYNPGPDPHVRVETDTTAGCVTVRIEDNGPGIDRAELDAIEAGEETQLEHSSGFGLWLAYWVIDVSGGDISFETGDGTTVILEFERAEEQPSDGTQ